jgi:ABC-type Fe3+/spermidine/putrescine transport system ATPase subunit
MMRLSLLNLTKSYGKGARPALDGVTLEVEPGERLALLGPSGCGKTTALKIIAGLLEPDSGDVLLDGASLLPVKPERRGLAMMFQQPLLFPYMTVADNVGFGLRMHKLAPDVIAKSTAAMLKKVQLENFGGRMPSELSGGQQQRVALARALVVEPKVLLLDEPLSDLDSNLREDMQDLLMDLQAQSGVTTVFVTHDQTEAVRLSHRIALMLDGRIHQIGPPEDLFARPADLATARFFGGRNFFPGSVIGGQFEASFGTLKLPDGIQDGPAQLTIRPESIVPSPSGINSFAAKITHKRFLGAEARLTLELKGVAVELAGAPDSMRESHPGASMSISFPPQSLWILRS